MTTFGWNATEIIVKDCDARRASEGHGFRVARPLSS